MELSRTTKNIILVALNGIAFLIQGAKWVLLEIQPMPSIKIWLFAVVPILFFNVIFMKNKIQSSWAHALLFLSTGAIFAFTLTNILKGVSQPSVLEYLWMVLGVVGIVVHYSKSKNDIYTSS